MTDDLTRWLMLDFGGDLEVLPEAPRWFRQAACLGSPLDFVEPGSSQAVQACLTLCERCPVRVECYDLAVAEGHMFGIFGGTTEKARAQARQAA